MPPPPSGFPLTPIFPAMTPAGLPKQLQVPGGGQMVQPNRDLRTVKLFWKEVQLQPPSVTLESKGVFWQKVKPVAIDTEKVVQLFETKANKEVTVKVRNKPDI